MWKVKLTIFRMGRRCASCRQEVEYSVMASSAEAAVENAKKLSGADPDTHKFAINFVRQVS